MSKEKIDFSNPSRTESTFFTRESDNMPMVAEYEEFDPPITLNPTVECHSRYVIKEVESQKEVWSQMYPNFLTESNITSKGQHIKNNQSEYL